MLHARLLVIGTILLTSGALAGCTSEEPGQTAETRDHAVDGSFTSQASQEEIDALERELEDVGAELVVLESSPTQYTVEGFTGENCEKVLEILKDHEAVDAVGPCEPAGDTTSSSNPYDAR